MSKSIIKKQRGFTLIEMLVSVALFSIVLTVTLGSIMTIADSNKKARSLMSVTNNLNFAVDSMVRSFKSGDSPGKVGECFSTFEVDYAETGSGDMEAQKRNVEYCFDDEEGRIYKRIGDAATGTPLTSSDVKIDYLQFDVSNTGPGSQPLLTIRMSGTVKVSEKISSSFSIHTNVSQRKLNI